MEQEQQLQLKMLFLLCYNLKIVAQWEGGIDFWWGGDKNLVGGGGSLQGGIFIGGGGEMSKFLTSGGTPPIPSNRENPTDSSLSRKLESDIFFFLDHLQILHRYFLQIIYFLVFFILLPKVFSLHFNIYLNDIT